MSGNDKNRSRIPLPKGKPISSVKGNSYYELERKRRGLGRNLVKATATATKSSRSEAPDCVEEVPVGDDVQSIGKNGLQKRSPALSVGPAFMEGQGDESAKKQVESGSGLFTVTSEGDSASVNKPLPNPKPARLVPAAFQEVESSDISDEKEVTVLYENPQSRLTVELSVDTSEECLESATNSVMEIMTHKSQPTEQTTSTCTLKSAQPLHEMLRDGEVGSKTKTTEDEEVNLMTTSIEDEEINLMMNSIEDEEVNLMMYSIRDEEINMMTNSIEDEEVNLMTNSIEDEEVNLMMYSIRDEEINLMTNSIEDEEVNLMTNSIEDEEVNLMTNSIEDEDINLIMNSIIEDEEINLMMNSIEDEDINLIMNSIEDEEINLIMNSIEDEETNLMMNSIEDEEEGYSKLNSSEDREEGYSKLNSSEDREEVDSKSKKTEQDECSSSLSPIEYSANLCVQENQHEASVYELYCDESTSEELVISDNRSSMEFGDPLSYNSFEQRHEELICFEEEEVADANTRAATAEEPHQILSDESETSLSNDGSVSPGLLIKKVLSSNLDTSVKQIINKIIYKATSVIEVSPSDSINYSNSNETFTVERIQLSELESGKKEISTSDVNWVQHFKAQYDHEQLLDTFISIKDSVAEDNSHTKLTRNVSEGWHEAMKIFSANVNYHTSSDSEDSCSVHEDTPVFLSHSQTFMPPDKMETCTFMKSSPVKMPTHPSPELIELDPENFQEMITKIHKIKEVVPKRAVLSKKVQKRGVADKITYSGSFMITNPTESEIAFEFSCNESTNPNRFHVTPSRGLLQAYEATNVTIAVPCSHLTESLLQGSKLYVRVLPVDSKITEIDKLAMLFRRNRQMDNPQGKSFSIIPVVQEEPDQNLDLDEISLRAKNNSIVQNVKVMITQLRSEVRDLSRTTKIVATFIFVFLAIYFTFHNNIRLINHYILSQALP